MKNKLRTLTIGILVTCAFAGLFFLIGGFVVNILLADKEPVWINFLLLCITILILLIGVITSVVRASFRR